MKKTQCGESWLHFGSYKVLLILATAQKYALKTWTASYVELAGRIVAEMSRYSLLL